MCRSTGPLAQNMRILFSNLSIVDGTGDQENSTCSGYWPKLQRIQRKLKVKTSQQKLWYVEINVLDEKERCMEWNNGSSQEKMN